MHDPRNVFASDDETHDQPPNVTPARFVFIALADGFRMIPVRPVISNPIKFG